MPSQPRNPLARWLKKHPQPTLIRCYTADGDESVIRIGVTSSKWRDAAESCERYARLEAMNDANQVLRVYKNTADPDEVDGTQTSKLLKHFDPETHRLEHFATLLAGAHDKGYVVVDKLTELVDRLLQRNAQVEAAWQKLLGAHANTIMRQAQVIGDENESGDDIMKTLLPAFIAAAAQRLGGAPPAEPPNGTPKPKG